MLQALALLTMALQLLIAANNPVIPESLKQQAISIANFAIKVANESLKETSVASISSAATSPAPVTVVLPPAPPPAPPPSDSTSPPPPPPPPQIIYVPVPVPVTPPSPPVPTVTLSSDKFMTAEGIYIVDDGKFTLKWTSTNADSCTGYAQDYESGYVSTGIRDPQKWGWRGEKSPSGTQIITAQSTGEYPFWIECRNSVSSKQSERVIIRIRQLSFTTPPPSALLFARKLNCCHNLATGDLHIYRASMLNISNSPIAVTSLIFQIDKDTPTISSPFLLVCSNAECNLENRILGPVFSPFDGIFTPQGKLSSSVVWDAKISFTIPSNTNRYIQLWANTTATTTGVLSTKLLDIITSENISKSIDAGPYVLTK